MKIIQPFILGHGRAGEAIAKAFSILSIVEPELKIAPTVFLRRGEKLLAPVDAEKIPVLAIANPHGLHAESILAGEAAGFSFIFSEKPVCARLEEIEKLRNLKTKVAVFHGYRQMWAPQTMKKICDAPEFGELFSIEGKYWQSSTATKALESSSKPEDWKNDTKMAGDFDVLLDLGTHWADLVMFFMNEMPLETSASLFYVNAESAHRDSHIHLAQKFSGDRRAFGSVSKTVHGATNNLEITLLGSRCSVTWKFLEPDQIYIGKGREISTITRQENTYGSTQSSFHAMGWLEGYIEIIRQGLRDLSGRMFDPYPNLESSLAVVETLLRTKQTR